VNYKYVEVEYIKQRLIGRLYFKDASIVATPGGVTTGGTGELCPVGARYVDPGFLDRVIKQKEAFLENYLNMIYLTPLRLISENTKCILSEIIEHLVVATLLPVYYQGGSIPQTGVDPSSLAGSSATSAAEMIQIYITGHNMYVPGVNSSPQSVLGGVFSQPVVLEGETLRSTDNFLDTNVRYESYVGNFNDRPPPADHLFDFDIL
jgi:hypothetical protein